MGRPKRILTTEFPFHIVQRGHDRKTAFRDPSDFKFFMERIAETKDKIPVKVFAFCLMTNHFHIVLQSTGQPNDISRFMRNLTSVYSKTFNVFGNRTGALWEGRFKSSLIETDQYLMACNRYVELNPVRAKMVEHVEQYPWTSFHHRSGFQELPWLDDDPCYLRMGKSKEERQKRYRHWMQDSIPKEETDFIRTAVRREFVIGNIEFKRTLAADVDKNHRKWF